MASDSRATTFPRMNRHFDWKSPDKTQHSMNRPVVISENDVDNGMLNPVSTARMQVARSSGGPAGSQSKRVSGAARVCKFVDKETSLLNVRQPYRQIGDPSQCQ